MTENEAIKQIEDYVKESNYEWTVKELFKEYIKRRNKLYVSYTANDVIDNCWRAFKFLEVKALEEVQEYRKLGTVEELKVAWKYVDLAKKHNTIGKVIESCAEYESIGTVEEVREAVEKNTPKKIVKKKDAIYSRSIDGEERYLYKLFCPNCGNGDLKRGFPCKCGQKLYWEGDKK